MPNLTLVDLMSRLDPKGNVAAVAEVLAKNNAIINDFVFTECNDKTGHKSVIRTGFPSVGWRKLNYGVQQSKSETQQVRDDTGMLEAVSAVDRVTADMSKDKAELFLTESSGFLEAMSQEWADTIFYGDIAKHPAKFNGLAMRYGKVSGNAPATKNVISAGSTSATGNTSIWLIGHGDGKVFGIYPEGSKAGLSSEAPELDKRWPDGNGGTFEAYVTRFKLHTGICVRDWRYVVRICNIKSDSLNASALTDLMIKAKRLLPSLNSCKPVFYANGEVLTALEQGLYNKSNVHLSLAEAQSGIQELRMSGIPLRQCDAISNNEAKVV